MNYTQNYDRQYRVTIGNSGEAYEIGGGDNPIHINFDIQKADTNSSNSAKVNLWNLSPTTLSLLEKNDCRLTLRAGYGTRMPLLFEGTVSYASTTLDNSDHKTEIELVDSLKYTRDSYVSLSYAEPVNWRKIFDDTADKMGVAVSYSYNASFVDISSGFSFVGKGTDVLTKGCNTCGLSWTIQNGILQVKKPNDTMTREVFVLSAETGLVGIPARVSLEKSNTTAKKLGYDVSFLLNGAIGVNDYVKLESKSVTGFFKVYSINHEGDNVSGDWISTARLEAVA